MPLPDLLKQVAQLPTNYGVYLFKNPTGEVLYVGKAVNLRARVRSYFSGQDTRPKIPLLLSQITEINHIEVDSEFEALLLEAALIKKHLPKFNTAAKDDKHPLYIAITKELFPKVRIIRRSQEIGKADIFGPFPSAATVRQVLKFLRRIFPFCSCKRNLGRPCIYASIGLCNPCPRMLTPPLTKGRQGGVKLDSSSKMAESQQRLTKQYRKQIKLLKRLLQGQAPQVLRSLQREMKIASKNQDFELAAYYRDGIGHLRTLLQPHQSIDLYLDKPNLRLEIRQSAVNELITVLNQNGIIPQIKKLERIEAYDISTLAGQYSTGSMVVFSNGLPDNSQYRRFKIKQEGQPNDVAMMREMLSRRFFHSRQIPTTPEHPKGVIPSDNINVDDTLGVGGEKKKGVLDSNKTKVWPHPDLLVVDGGKPQISTALNVFKKHHLQIPVMGLTKRFEEIIIYSDDKSNNFVTLRLPRSSLTLQIIQHLRDEAHRFANRYRKQLIKI